MKIGKMGLLLGGGALLFSATAFAGPPVKEGWVSNGYYQWHPQVGAHSLAKAGTQCYFCQASQMDSDGDGVADDVDACPNTPTGALVDARGCPLTVDSDNDGVLDDQDRCPGTPSGTPVDATGCPVDSDNDGVMDKDDRCPGTPANVPVDQYGCPKDADSDGVSDDTDKCANTPSGAQVNQQGCWVLKNLHFGTGKWNIQPGDYPVLNDAVHILEKNPSMRVEIQGHTDNRGGRKYNQALSQKRAEAVRRYLISKGIKSKRLSMKGFGLDRPVDSNDTEAGRANNRRVQLEPQGK